MTSHDTHYYFLGIAGQAMSGLAVAVKQRGFIVSGADAHAYPPATDALDAAGIHYHQQYDAGHIDPSMTIILGNAVTADNPELHAAQQLDLTILSYPELVATLTQDQQRLVVAGTHGKTTTASLIAWLLEACGQHPDFILGMTSLDFGTSVRLTGSPYVVIEGDEYAASALDRRSKFLHYHPQRVVLTSLDWDHPDLFPTVASLRDTYRDLLHSLPDNARVVACADEPALIELLREEGVTAVTYGVGDGAFLQARDITYTRHQTAFTLMIDGVVQERWTMQLAGEHNVKNVLAALGVLWADGWQISSLAAGLLSFRGASRRFEVVGEVNGVTVIDDYAHNPQKVEATLRAAQARYPEGRLWAFFAPHTYSRTEALLAEFAQALLVADVVIVTDIEAARETGQAASVHARDLVAQLAHRHNHTHYLADPTAARRLLLENVQPGDVVVCMSVSGVDRFSQRLVDALEAQWPGA